MLMLITGSSSLFCYTVSSLQVTPSVAQAIGEMHANRWLILAAGRYHPGDDTHSHAGDHRSGAGSDLVGRGAHHQHGAGV